MAVKGNGTDIDDPSLVEDDAPVEDRIDADDDALVTRYKETRRRHPLSPEGSVAQGINDERALVEPLRAMRYIHYTAWIARRWDPAVQQRYARLLRALADSLDGRIEALVLPETSTEFGGGPSHLPSGFTPESWRDGRG